MRASRIPSSVNRYDFRNCPSPYPLPVGKGRVRVFNERKGFFSVNSVICVVKKWRTPPNTKEQKKEQGG